MNATDAGASALSTGEAAERQPVVDTPTDPVADAPEEEREHRIGTVDEILEKGPEDITSETVHVPEWDCSVVIKSFTAYENATIKQKSLILGKENPDVAWAEMEVAQFQQGVVEPSFTPHQVRKLHQSSGRGFSRVIAAIDELNGNDKEALQEAQEEFRGSDE
jgi:hypothetical protein